VLSAIIPAEASEALAANASVGRKLTTKITDNRIDAAAFILYIAIFE
jgi:hypothetical protein